MSDLGPQLTPLRPCFGCPDCQPETPCARCGVVILARAPRVEQVVNRAFTQYHAPDLVKHTYHPGCWAAEQAATRALP